MTEDHATRVPSASERAALERARIEEELDEALAASFPASDPVSLTISEPEEDRED
ncbi:MAG: hypothetical protein IPI06_09530 [Gammaproteobacteria bacterium]|nr:hypothetical protein [Gammaproteobacteria bacterium]